MTFEQVKLLNLPEVEAAIDHAVAKIEKVSAGALYREAERMMTQSKREAPVDVGAMRSTGHVEAPMVSAEGIEVALGYGGPSGVTTKDGKSYVGYALYVHENLDAHHTVGKAKFLEDPVRHELDSGAAMERLKSDIARGLLG